MKGYPKLAALMGAYPEIATFRRFGALNAENLLYFQAELTRLEIDLRSIAEENDTSSDERRALYSTHWLSLNEAEKTPNGDPRQWNTILQIRKTLKEYNEALLQQNLLAKLPTPAPKDREFLVEWMERPTMGSVFLIGGDKDSWNDANAADLITAKARGDEDPFSSWIMDYFIHVYHQVIGWFFKEPEDVEYASNTVYYSNRAIIRVVLITGIVLASLLPLASIAVLNTVASTPKKIGVIGGFTAVFTLCLGLLTKARMVDIFAATAAFAAVQVVFIGTNNCCGPASNCNDSC